MSYYFNNSSTISFQKMIRFECDYAEGAHPKVLEALVKTNFEQTPGYGVDGHCAHAQELIREACEDPLANVFLLPAELLPT